MQVNVATEYLRDSGASVKFMIRVEQSSGPSSLLRNSSAEILTGTPVTRNVRGFGADSNLLSGGRRVLTMYQIAAVEIRRRHTVDARTVHVVRISNARTLSHLAESMVRDECGVEETENV